MKKLLMLIVMSCALAAQTLPAFADATTAQKEQIERAQRSARSREDRGRLQSHVRGDDEERAPEAGNSAQLIQRFLDQARQKLAKHHPATMALLRGFACRPMWPSFREVFGLRGAAFADYPMYRGVAGLLGMTALDCEASLESKITAVKKHWDQFDFFHDDAKMDS